jgi:hypothetical protein
MRLPRALTQEDGFLLQKAYKEIDRTPLDYVNRWYATILKFLSLKGMRMVPNEVVAAEEAILMGGHATEYVMELRDVVDPTSDYHETDQAVLMIAATADEKLEAIKRLRVQGLKI